MYYFVVMIACLSVLLNTLHWEVAFSRIYFKLLSLDHWWQDTNQLIHGYTVIMMMMMMMMMMKNGFCGMVDQRKVYSLISSQNHYQRSLPSWISHTPRAGFEPVQNINLGLVEWRCGVVKKVQRRHQGQVAS